MARKFQSPVMGVFLCLKLPCVCLGWGPRLYKFEYIYGMAFLAHTHLGYCPCAISLSLSLSLSQHFVLILPASLFKGAGFFGAVSALHQLHAYTYFSIL